MDYVFLPEDDFGDVFVAGHGENVYGIGSVGAETRLKLSREGDVQALNS